MQNRTCSISDVCIRFIDIVIHIHMTGTIACLTLCMHFMHTATGISSGVISVVLIVCTTCLIQFAFFCRVTRIASLKLHFVVSREQWYNLYDFLKAQSEYSQRLWRDLFASSGIKSTIIFQKARNIQHY